MNATHPVSESGADPRKTRSHQGFRCKNVLHIIKLAVGCDTLGTLAQRMEQQMLGGRRVVHTRTMPKRADEVLAGGSLYRVVDGLVLCRQPIIGLETTMRPDGTQGTLIVVSDAIIPVQPRPMRPFQGWRYLKPEDAPADLSSGGQTDGLGAMPPEMRRELA